MKKYKIVDVCGPARQHFSSFELDLVRRAAELSEKYGLKYNFPNWRVQELWTTHCQATYNKIWQDPTDVAEVEGVFNVALQELPEPPTQPNPPPEVELPPPPPQVEEIPPPPSIDESPVEEPAIEEPPVEEAPVEDTPTDEPPVEEPPAEESPVEDYPAEETPVEDPPEEETPPEEVPVEEPPAEEETP